MFGSHTKAVQETGVLIANTWDLGDATYLGKV